MLQWISNNSPWYSSDASNDLLNDDKNRYSNITACEPLPSLFLLCSFCVTCTSFYSLTFCLTVDHSRVRLTPIEGVECSDYINANYVTVSFYFLGYETLVSVNVTLGISCLYKGYDFNHFLIVAGLPICPGVHSNSRPPGSDRGRLLADGLGAELCHYCHADKS